MSDYYEGDIVYPTEAPTSTTVIIIFVVILVLAIGAFSVSVLCYCFQCHLNFAPPDFTRLLPEDQVVADGGVVGNHVDHMRGSDVAGGSGVIQFEDGDGTEVKYSVSNKNRSMLFGENPLDTISRCRSASPLLQDRTKPRTESMKCRSSSLPTSLDGVTATWCSTKGATTPPPPPSGGGSATPPKSRCGGDKTPNCCQINCTIADPLSLLLQNCRPSRIPLRLSISRDLRGDHTQHSASSDDRGLSCSPIIKISPIPAARVGCVAAGQCCLPRSGVSVDSCKSHTTTKQHRVAKQCGVARQCDVAKQHDGGNGECSAVTIRRDDCSLSREFTHSKEYDEVFSWHHANSSLPTPVTSTVVEIHNPVSCPGLGNIDLRSRPGHNDAATAAACPGHSDTRASCPGTVLRRAESEPSIDYCAVVCDTLDDLERHIGMEDSTTSPSDEDYFSTHSDLSLDSRRLSQRRSRFFSLNSLTNHVAFFVDPSKRSSECLLKNKSP